LERVRGTYPAGNPFVEISSQLGSGDALACHLAQSVSMLDWPVDLITAVPAGKHRLAERGYNQVALVAKPMASILKKRYMPKILSRARETRSQVGLSHEQLESNVAGAFQAAPLLVTGKTILVVDDVATSGATLAACADALVKAGAKAVYAFTLARALPRHGLQIV
jgi:competence protein ComFC